MYNFGLKVNFVNRDYTVNIFNQNYFSNIKIPFLNILGVLNLELYRFHSF